MIRSMGTIVKRRKNAGSRNKMREEMESRGKMEDEEAKKREERWAVEIT